MIKHSLLVTKVASTLFIGVLLVLSVLFLPLAATSQGITYLSNLMEPPGDSNSVSTNSWLLETFRTGPSSNGYVLNSIQVAAGAVGFPVGDFQVYLYSNSITRSPIALLSGPNPSTFGTYTYTSPGIPLSPSSGYGVVVTATTPDDPNNCYFWNRDDYADLANYSSVDNWKITGFNATFSPDGTNWFTSLIVSSPLQFAINATPVAAILSGSLTNGGFNLNFQTISNRNYTVQFKLDLADTNWTFFTNFSGDGSIVSISVPATNSAQFFRVSTQ